MRQILRASLRVLQIALLAAAVLVVFALAVLTGRLPSAARVLVEWSAARALEAEVQVRSVRGSFLGAFELAGVSITRPSAQTLDVQSIWIEIGEVSLAQRYVVLESLTIAGAELRVQGSPDAWRIAGWPLGAAEAESPGESSFAITMRNLTLAEIGVDLDFQGAPQQSAAARARLNLEARRVHWPPDSTHSWPSKSQGDLAIERASWSGRELGSGQLALRQDGPALSFDLRAELGGTITASGRADVGGALDAPTVAGVAATLRFDDIDLAALTGDPALDSSLTGDFRGTWDGSVVAGQFSLDPSRWGPEAVETAEFAGRLWPADDWAFELTTAKVSAPFAKIDASGAGNRTGARLLRVQRLAVDLAALPPRWRPNPELRGGRVRVEGELTGAWRDLRGPWALQLEQLNWADRLHLDGTASGQLLGQRRARIERLELDPSGLADLGRITSTAAFELEWLPSGAAVDGAALRVAGGSLDLSGGFGAGAFRNLRVVARDLELPRILRLDAQPTPSGQLDAAFELDGPLEQPRVAGSLAVKEPAFNGLQAEAISVTVAPVPDTPTLLDVRATLVRAGRDRARLDVRLSSHSLLTEPFEIFSEPGVRADVTLDQLELAALSSLLPEGFPTAGCIDGAFQVIGPIELPELAGRLVWHEPIWRELEAERIEVEIAPVAGAGAWSGTAAVVREGSHSLDARFQFPRRALHDPLLSLRDPETHLSVRLRAFELAWLTPLAGTRAPALSGQVQGTVDLVGARPVPRAEGELELTELRVAGPPLPTAVGPASGRLLLRGHSAELETLQLVSQQGEARLSGRFDWQNPNDPTFDVRIELSEFGIAQPGTLEGLLDGDVRVQGRPAALRATGELSLHEAVIDLPEIEDPVIREIRVHGLPETADTPSIFEAEGGFLGAVEADVGLEIGDSVWLRGLGAELELRGNLRVRKAPKREPGLFGSVETTTGRIDFRRKWLRVDQGSAVFDGSPDPDPYLDITAVHRVREVEIRVRIYGKASEPQIELDSDPPLSPEEQLAYLLFDRPITDLGAEDQNQLGTAAGILAADALLGEFGTELARSVGLDRIRLGVDEAQAPVLEVEKQIHPRLTARYGRSFGAEGGDRFVLEWRLFRRLFLIGDQRTSGDSGVGLQWRFDF